MTVGRTPIIRSKELSGRCHGANAYIMCENQNPFGTFKDRGNLGALEQEGSESLGGRRELEVVVGITYGNAGYSLGMLAGDYRNFIPDSDIIVVNIVPDWLSPDVEALLRTCSIVHRMNLDDHKVTKDEMRQIARSATSLYGSMIRKIHVIEETDYLARYKEIIDEIQKAGIRPTHIFCPVGGGGLLTGLAVQAERIWGERAPLIVGATVPGNALVSNGAPQEVKGTIADKLANRFSPLAAKISSLISKGKVKLLSFEDREISRMYEYLDEKGILAEPSAAVAFCGAQGYPLTPNDTIVIINTGRGVCHDLLHGPARCKRRASERNPEVAEGLLADAVNKHDFIGVVSALREAPGKAAIADALIIARQGLADKEWDIRDSIRFRETFREVMFRAVAEVYISIIGTLEIASRWPEDEARDRQQVA